MKSGRSDERMSKIESSWPCVVCDGSTIKMDETAQAADKNGRWRSTAIIASELVDTIRVALQD